MATRPIRIAGASGAASDRRHALADFARNHPRDPIDVVVQDYMSEYNMSVAAARRISRSEHAGGNAGSEPRHRSARPAYEVSFLEALEPALLDIARYGIKVVTNAGVADTEALYRAVAAMVEGKGVQLKVAWISGDEVLHTVKDRQRSGAEFKNIYTGEVLSQWPFEPIYAQGYLGGMGIAAALGQGADIVVCGRVSDASPIIGAACWWHHWPLSDIHKLANAFVAGHLIECSTYVTGGNFTGFKQIEDAPGDDGWKSLGFPIAEISFDGEVVITKQNYSTGGAVTVDTCSSQLLYEIQGPVYLNSDVTAILDEVHFEQLSANRIALRGVKADLPPPTTKVGITARGGYQAEVVYFLVGLDIAAKARMLESQIRHLLSPYSKHFTSLTFSTLGACPDDPPNQNSATTALRILAQAPRAEYLASRCFVRPVTDSVMQSYPGATFNLDLRQAFPKPVFEYYVTLLPQADINHQAHLPWLNTSLPIAPPPNTKLYHINLPSATTTTTGPADIPSDFGPTTRGPLGWLVHARSGDKGPDANCGFWVRSDSEYAWLRTLLSTRKVQELLGGEWRDDGSMSIERFELPKLRGVHFLFRNFLDRGVAVTATVDFLGKNVAEYLRARWVDLPDKFLNKGRL
ncbi:DUF1446 domain-containing protein [Arthroderma uncinatum]|uniref:DUF1446 domain-containing protein n=1 Tax=Arthroderma uncinatum TaxID=74035 RepID=UPI00144AACD9|nr:DUF1446 domain-containing protein [Arthroderma uncinatum]KAF3490795.1 DUF1446 domain-containing protein [Arthroderma uncinatum]